MGKVKSSKKESGTSREKHLQISEDLRQEIKKGKWTVKIPSLNELVRKYGVCVITANKAVNTLVDEGILYRQPGKGTFINNERKTIKQKMVGVFMCASGHMFENLARSIQNELHNKGFLSSVIDFVNIDETQLLKRLEELVAMNPEAIIFQATHSPNGSLCADYFTENAEKIKKMIVVLDAEYKGDLKAACVLSDSWHGGYIATKHLVDLGHRRILHAANEPMLPVQFYRKTCHYQRVLGYKMAMEEKNLQEEIIYENLDKEKFLQDLEAAFKRKDRPTAVFTRQDSTALEIYRLLKKLNLKVPEDVALVGYFNTPWCEVLDPPLTSVSIRVDEFGRAIAETISKNTGIIEEICIKPELIVRESSGGKVKP